MNGNSFEFSGYIESINIKGAGPNSNQCLFSIVNKKGDKHWSFLVDTHTSEPRYNAMVSLITAAFASDKIVSINTAPHIGGLAYAAEIEVRRSE